MEASLAENNENIESYSSQTRNVRRTCYQWFNGCKAELTKAVNSSVHTNKRAFNIDRISTDT